MAGEAGTAAAAAAWRRVHRVRRRPPPVPADPRHAAARWAFAARIATAPRTSSCIVRERSTWSSTSRTRASRTPSSCCTASRWLRWPCASTTPRARAPCHFAPGEAVRRPDRRRANSPFRRSAASAAACSTSWTGAESAGFVAVDFQPDAEPAGGADWACWRSTIWPRSCRRPSSWAGSCSTAPSSASQPEARTDLNDPRGLIVSRALSNPERSLRIPLNASQAQASAAGRFIERTAGAGAQHIAFSCGDVFAVADRVPNELQLPIPENYYEDSGSALLARRCARRAATRREHPLRPRGRGRVPAFLHPHHQRPVLRGAGAARRLRSLRRGQRPGPPRRPGAAGPLVGRVRHRAARVEHPLSRLSRR